MQGIYNYITETSHESTAYSVASLLWLQFVLHVILFRLWNTFCTFTLALSVVCVQFPIWLFFFLFPYFCAFLICCSGDVCVILKWFQSLLLLPVSLLMSHSTCAEFLLWGLYILKSTQLLSLSHYCLQELHHLLTCMYYHGLWCPVYC